MVAFDRQLKLGVGLPDGFVMRPTQMSDLDDVVELFNICSLDQIGKVEFQINDVGNEWQLPTFDLESSTRVVITPNGQIVGYIEIWDNRDPAVRVWAWGRVHPAYEGQGIGSALMRWGEERARLALDRTPEEARVVLQAGALSTHGPSSELLKSFEMEPIRHFFRMQIELNGHLPLPQWPEGIRLELYRHPQQAEVVYSAFREIFRDHWGHIEEPYENGLQNWSHYRFNDEGFDPDCWFLAMDGDEIAGFSICRPYSYEDPKEGYVATLGVARAWRRRGLGLALLHHSFRVFSEAGQERAALHVDAGSLTGATRLYEKAGMHVQRQMITYEKELRPGIDLMTQALED